jgi:WS/DGAT/MGAT family acyltransferase
MDPRVSNALRDDDLLDVMPPDEPMSWVDTAWLRMDSASNLMLIVGIWMVQPRVHYADVCRRVTACMRQYPRFMQRVRHDATGYTWTLDPNFDIKRHVVPETLPLAPGQDAQQALQDRLGELAMQPLDLKHPLWQFHWVEQIGPKVSVHPSAQAQRGSALLVRIHHCVADGMALMEVTHSLTDDGMALAARRGPRRQQTMPAPTPNLNALLQPLTRNVVGALETAGDLAVNALHGLRQPLQSLQPGLKNSVQQGLEGGAALARQAAQGVRDAAALAFMFNDSSTRLKGTLAGRKRVAWCAPLPLREVQAVAQGLHCSVNDVLLSCVTGALGAYLRDLGDSVAGQEIRAMVPVNLRSAQDLHQLGNKFGLAPVLLPLGLDHPVERVYEVRRRMADMKGGFQPLLSMGLLALGGALVQSGQDLLIKLFSSKTTAVVSNVIGPRNKMRFCGATVEQDLFWVPQSGSVGLGISIFSYGGNVQFGLIADTAFCPQPQDIVDRFEPEFAKLSWVALMLPWED